MGVHIPSHDRRQPLYNFLVGPDLAQCLSEGLGEGLGQLPSEVFDGGLCQYLCQCFGRGLGKALGK